MLRSIGFDIDRFGAQGRQTIQLGLNPFIFASPADPDHLCLIRADHMLGPGFSYASGAANHNVHPILPVQECRRFAGLNGDQTLSVPLPVSVSPSFSLGIQRNAKEIFHLNQVSVVHINQPDVPVPKFLGSRSHEAMNARMGRIYQIVLQHKLRTFRNHSPA
ncbi:hypothetical protein D3C81_1819630 [compost metagenome]